MSLSKFIGREAEMTRLKGLLTSRSASLIVAGEDGLAKVDFLQNSERRSEVFSFPEFLQLERQPLNLNAMNLTTNLNEPDCLVSNQMIGEIFSGISPNIPLMDLF